MNVQLLFPLICSLLALGFVIILSIGVLKKEEGTQKMKDISRLIQEGAKAFLKREYSYIAVFVVLIAGLIGITPFISKGISLGWKTSVAFIIGSFVSAFAGYIGMSIATRTNSRTANAASKGGVKDALNVAISGGSVMGMSVVGLALLGLILVYFIFKGDPVIINGYAMGASLVALFARSGGGIFTKGADMGADLVGKVEAGIPEDDPRNPGVIADNVGDNVGDVAGLGADLLESYVESIIASIAIGSTFVVIMGQSVADKLKFMPIYIAGAGIIASIIGIIYVKLFGKKNPQGALMSGTYISAILSIVGTYFIVSRFGVAFGIYSKLGPFYATLAGIISGMAIGFTSEFFTSTKYKPVKELAKSSKSGPAITITGGLAVGMESTCVPVLVLAAAIMIAYHFAGGYGVAMAAVGMLATTGMIVSVDSYGPIADNAGGIAEMAKLDPSVRKITDNLDAVGNTTAAIGKGFAIGSAAFATIGLVSAYIMVVGIKGADITDPKVMSGLLIGGMLPFLFSSMLFKAVSKAAYELIDEVRRQFREIKGLMEGEVMPDSATCVDLATKGAIHGMLLPGAMAIVAPVAIGLLLGPKALAGLLVGALISGLMLGIQMANSGGAMDNAKKYIEEGNFGGKGSEAHKAAVIGDTVGDPLKDTVGPSINILIKLMSIISLVLAPLFVKF